MCVIHGNTTNVSNLCACVIVTPITHEAIHKTVWDVYTNGNVFPRLTVWDVHMNGNVLLGLTVGCT